MIGLGVCSVVTLGAATRDLVARQPHYYVDRQAIYLIVGVLLMLALSRMDYSRLRPLKNGIYGALILSILAVLGLGHTAAAPSARSACRSSPSRPPSSARCC